MRGVTLNRLRASNLTERGLLGLTAAFLITSVTMVSQAAAPYEALNGASAFTFVARDLAYVAVGLVGFFMALRMPMRTLRLTAVPLLGLSLLLLAYVYLKGHAQYGGQRWISFGGLTIQPSEVFKLTGGLFLATFLPRARALHRGLLPEYAISAFVMLGVLLILIEPDLGTAAIVGLMTFMALALNGMASRALTWTAGTLGVLAVASLLSSSYQRERVLSFLHLSHKAGASDQATQAKIAIGSGGLFGLGSGHSRAIWGALPNAHTDFIFAVVGEEFGLIGTIFVLGLFLLLVIFGMRAAASCKDPTSGILAGCITLWFGAEAVINLASVTGAFPVTGVPLPFLSYGGSALIVDLFAMGLLVNIARHQGIRHAEQSRLDRMPALAFTRPSIFPGPSTSRSLHR